MATYIMLLRSTQPGMQNIEEAPARIHGAKQALRNLGAEVKAFYSVLGQYDIVIVAEAPDDETIAKAALVVSSLGNVRVETLRAFKEDEFRKIVASLP